MFSFVKLVTLAVAAVIANVVVASPTATVTVINASDMIVGGTTSKRSTDQALAGTVFFCTDANFSGNCFHYVDIPDNNLCFSMPPGFDNDISSFGPDNDLTCILYTDGACAAGPGERSSGSIFFPGSTNLANINFNDVTSSFTCNFL